MVDGGGPFGDLWNGWAFWVVIGKVFKALGLGFRGEGLVWYFPKIGGPHYRPQCTTTLIMGTPKKGTPNFGVGKP